MDSSDSWVCNDRDKSYAFILAEAGYDVWLPNHRGNKYTNLHLDFDPTQSLEYWEHSFPEMALYDMPAFVKYIRRETKMNVN